VWARRHIGPANRGRFVVNMRQFNEPQGVGLLKKHAAGHDEISPLEIGFVKRLGIPVDEPDGPMGRQHRRQCNQPQWDRGIAGAKKFSGNGIVPERFRAELRIDQEDIAR
jgi:hypothetical protein